MIEPNELIRVASGPPPQDVPRGIGTIDLIAACSGNARDVLERTREVLEVVLAAPASEERSLKEWQRVLPAWFVAACAPELTKEEADRHIAWLRSLSPEEKVRVAEEAPWTLSGWLYWFESGEREWVWWDAVVKDANTLRVEVEVPGWPTALSALEWLLRAAGATRVVVEDEEGAEP